MYFYYIITKIYITINGFISDTLQIFKIALLGLSGDTGTFYLLGIYLQYAYVFMDWAEGF